MPVRKASAAWEGGLKDGKGAMRLGSGSFEGKYSFGSRFEEARGTNPEELIAAAHAGCFSMALAASLGKAGLNPKKVSTDAKVHIGMVDGAPKITAIDLSTEAEVPGADPEKFQEIAEGAKANCPVSKALQAVEIRLDAKLIG